MRFVLIHTHLFVGDSRVRLMLRSAQCTTTVGCFLFFQKIFVRKPTKSFATDSYLGKRNRKIAAS
jgi:hypothetical protein